MTKDVGFMELIEIHERRWGTTAYPGRPTLKELMESPIVAVWGQQGAFGLSVYGTADDINKAITDIFTGKAGQLDNRRLVKIFYKHQPMPFALQIIRIGQIPQLPTAESKPVSISRFYQVQEAMPARFGYNSPGRNPKLLPGRKPALIRRNKGQ